MCFGTGLLREQHEAEAKKEGPLTWRPDGRRCCTEQISLALGHVSFVGMMTKPLVNCWTRPVCISWFDHWQCFPSHCQQSILEAEVSCAMHLGRDQEDVIEALCILIQDSWPACFICHAPPRTRLCFTGPVEEVCRSELWRSFWPQSVNRKGTAKSYELNLREFCGNSNRSWPDSAMACGD